MGVGKRGDVSGVGGVKMGGGVVNGCMQTRMCNRGGGM